jgi:hypothetical protein
VKCNIKKIQYGVLVPIIGVALMMHCCIETFPPKVPYSLTKEEARGPFPSFY